MSTEFYVPVHTAADPPTTRYVVMWSEDAAAAAGVGAGWTHIIMAKGEFTDFECRDYVTNLRTDPFQPRSIPAQLVEFYIPQPAAELYGINTPGGSSICMVCGRGAAHMGQCECCKLASYCSILCQRADWRAHKPTCTPRVDIGSRRRLRALLHKHKTYGWGDLTHGQFDSLLHRISNGYYTMIPRTVPSGTRT